MSKLQLFGRPYVVFDAHNKNIDPTSLISNEGVVGVTARLGL